MSAAGVRAPIRLRPSRQREFAALHGSPVKRSQYLTARWDTSALDQLRQFQFSCDSADSGIPTPFLRCSLHMSPFRAICGFPIPYSCCQRHIPLFRAHKRFANPISRLPRPHFVVSSPYIIGLTELCDSTCAFEAKSHHPVNNYSYLLSEQPIDSGYPGLRS